MKLEAVRGFFRQVCYFSNVVRVGVALGRERGLPVSRVLRRIGPVLWAWPTGKPSYVPEVLSGSYVRWGLNILYAVHKSAAPP